MYNSDKNNIRKRSGIAFNLPRVYICHYISRKSNSLTSSTLLRFPGTVFSILNAYINIESPISKSISSMFSFTINGSANPEHDACDSRHWEPNSPILRHLRLRKFLTRKRTLCTITTLLNQKQPNGISSFSNASNPYRFPPQILSHTR